MEIRNDIALEYAARGLYRLGTDRDDWSSISANERRNWREHIRAQVRKLDQSIAEEVMRQERKKPAAP